MLDLQLRELPDTTDDAFRPYDRYGTPVAGMYWLPLSSETNGNFECFLLRMDAGARSRPHEHIGHEEFLVLEGSLLDCDGREYQAGEYVHFKPGSKHSAIAPRGCKLLVILRGGNNRALSETEISQA